MAEYIIHRVNATSELSANIRIQAPNLPQAKRVASRYYAVDGYDITIFVDTGVPHALARKRWIVSADGLHTYWGKWEALS